jgi:hypothetical protein
MRLGWRRAGKKVSEASGFMHSGLLDSSVFLVRAPRTDLIQATSAIFPGFGLVGPVLRLLVARLAARWPT